MKLEDVVSPIFKAEPTWKELVEHAKATMSSTQFKKWKEGALRAMFHGKLDGKAAAKARMRHGR